MKRNNLLCIENLEIMFNKGPSAVKAVDRISFELEQGEILGIVGESGSGKSALAESIMFSDKGKIEGAIFFRGENLLAKSANEMQSIRGKCIGMIFQDPLTSLNPTMTIGNQIAEILIQHEGMNKKTSSAKVLELLKLVGIPDSQMRMGQYPYQLSGGMRQRVMIAIAMACSPELIIADEPTTGLDVTIQAQVIALLKDLCKKQNAGMLFISHDMGVVAGLCDRVVVMKEGRIVEIGTVDEVFYHPEHPYTQFLLSKEQL